MNPDTGPQQDNGLIFYTHDNDQIAYIDQTRNGDPGLWSTVYGENGDRQLSGYLPGFGMDVDLEKTPIMRPSLAYQPAVGHSMYNSGQGSQDQQLLFPINHNFQQPQLDFYTHQPSTQLFVPDHYDHQIQVSLPPSSYIQNDTQHFSPDCYDESSLLQSSSQASHVFPPAHYDHLPSSYVYQGDQIPHLDLNTSLPNYYYDQNYPIESNGVATGFIDVDVSHEPSYRSFSTMLANQHTPTFEVHQLPSNAYEELAALQLQRQQQYHSAISHQRYERFPTNNFDLPPAFDQVLTELGNSDELAQVDEEDWYMPANNVEEYNEPQPNPLIIIPPSRMRNPHYLIDRLSKEVHIMICEYLGPREQWKWAILRLNNYIHTMTDRGLWCRILRRFCKRNSIHYTFYPIDNHTFWGTVRLFAEGPMQWRYRLRNELDGELPGDNCVRYFDCRDPELQIQPVRHNLFMSLVPGGRYLVVDNTRRMNIWDLGLGAGADLVCPASVIHELPKGSSRKKAKLEVYPAPDKHDFRVLIYFPTFTPKTGEVDIDIGTYAIYNVHPPNPIYPKKKDKFEITLIIKAFNEAKRGLYAVSGDLYATFFPETNTLTIQNIISRTIENIKIDLEDIKEQVERIIIRESEIGIPILIVVTMSQIYVYAFSPCLLDSGLRYDVVESNSNKPTLKITVNFLEQVQFDFSQDAVYGSPYFDFPPRWYETSDRPLIMDIVSCKTQGKVVKDQRRWRYELSFKVSNTTLQLSGSVILLRKLVLPHLSYQHNFGFSDDQIFIGGIKNNEAAIAFGLATQDSSTALTSRRYRKSEVACLLHRDVKADIKMMRDFELCVISGRICFFPRETPYMVCIIDQYTLDDYVEEDYVPVT